MATMPAQRQLSWDEFSSDGEEIVYLDSVLASPALISEPGDGDYILVPHLRSPSMHSGSPPHSARQRDTEAELSSALSALSLAPAPVFVPAKAPNASEPSAKVQGSPRQPATPKQKRKKKSTGGDGKQPAPHTKKGTPTASAPDSAYPSPPATPAVPRRRKQKKNTPKQGTGETGLGARTVVDDVSDLGDDTDNAAYADARSYIASHLANPPPVLTNGMLLPLLQALIVELGLSAPEHKPSSVTAARGLLKSRAFIGIREYLAAREAGREAIQRAMHPSRTSLVRALRKGSAARAPRAWVKSTGLAVLLVNTHN